MAGLRERKRRDTYTLRQIDSEEQNKAEDQKSAKGIEHHTIQQVRNREEKVGQRDAALEDKEHTGAIRQCTAMGNRGWPHHGWSGIELSIGERAYPDRDASICRRSRHGLQESCADIRVSIQARWESLLRYPSSADEFSFGRNGFPSVALRSLPLMSFRMRSIRTNIWRPPETCANTAQLPFTPVRILPVCGAAPAIAASRLR